MNNDNGTMKQDPERGLYGKLIGVVRYRSQLKPLCESLSTLGISDVTILDGPSGTQKLEAWKETVSQYFFGDMEGEMLGRYLDAVRNELIVFAAETEPEHADEAAEIATTHGASEVAHFGNSVITNY
jgi:hypothetical protein